MAKTTWNLDTAHSEIQFKVKHMMISTVTGHFKTFDGSIESEGDDFKNAQINFTAEIDSITTNNEKRDEHLKSTDFFDAANHPKLVFKSTKMEAKSDEEFTLEGELSMHGITKPVQMKVNYGGTIKDPYGLTRAGFELEGKIDRKDFGLSWNALTEAGGVVVSEDVKIYANVEFTKAQ